MTKSQIAFRRHVAFAQAWLPARYLRGPVASLVLTLSFRYRDASPRWKEIVEPAPGRFTHHLELHALTDIDDEVRDWLRNAWMTAVLGIRETSLRACSVAGASRCART